MRDSREVIQYLLNAARLDLAQAVLARKTSNRDVAYNCTKGNDPILLREKSYSYPERMMVWQHRRSNVPSLQCTQSIHPSPSGVRRGTYVRTFSAIRFCFLSGPRGVGAGRIESTITIPLPNTNPTQPKDHWPMVKMTSLPSSSPLRNDSPTSIELRRSAAGLAPEFISAAIWAHAAAMCRTGPA